MSFDNWKEYIFSEFIDINPSVRLDSSKDYSFVEMKDLNEKQKFAYPSAKRKLSGGARFQEYDTLFARITPCLENGKICQVRGLENGVGFGSTEFLVFRGRKSISDNDFVFYLSRYSEVRQFAEQNMLGTSGRQRVTWDSFDKLELSLPPLLIQRRIASTLSALDDKIELNSQTNQTLEAIVQAIYKEWFINFNFPGATGEMQDSELGLIPKGWRIISLGEIADLTWGDTNTTKKSYVPFGYPAFSASGRDGFLPYHDFDRDGIVVSAIGAYAGKTWFAIGKWSCIKNTIRFCSINPEISNEYLYMATSGPDFWPLRGSAQPFISQTDARGLKVLFPSGDIAKTFGEVTRSMFRQIEENDIQNNYLGQVRDGLLPKLMNGEIEL